MSNAIYYKGVKYAGSEDRDNLIANANLVLDEETSIKIKDNTDIQELGLIQGQQTLFGNCTGDYIADGLKVLRFTNSVGEVISPGTLGDYEFKNLIRSRYIKPEDVYTQIIHNPYNTTNGKKATVYNTTEEYMTFGANGNYIIGTCYQNQTDYIDLKKDNISTSFVDNKWGPIEYRITQNLMSCGFILVHDSIVHTEADSYCKVILVFVSINKDNTISTLISPEYSNSRVRLGIHMSDSEIKYAIGITEEHALKLKEDWEAIPETK